MTRTRASAEAIGDRTVVITRDFAAPRDLVFKAFTEREHFMAWFGPEEFGVPDCSIDLQPEGKLHYSMQGPDGEKHWGIGIFKEIQPPSRLVYLDAFSDEEGNVVPPESTITMSFVERGGTTTLRMETVFDSAEGRDQVLAMGMAEGWESSFMCLDEHLAAQQG